MFDYSDYSVIGIVSIIDYIQGVVILLEENNSRILLPITIDTSICSHYAISRA